MIEATTADRGKVILSTGGAIRQALSEVSDELLRLQKIERAARVVERKIGREARALKELADHIEAGEGDASEIRCHEGGLIHAREILRRALECEDD